MFIEGYSQFISNLNKACLQKAVVSSFQTPGSTCVLALVRSCRLISTTKDNILCHCFRIMLTTIYSPTLHTNRSSCTTVRVDLPVFTRCLQTPSFRCTQTLVKWTEKSTGQVSASSSGSVNSWRGVSVSLGRFLRRLQPNRGFSLARLYFQIKLRHGLFMPRDFHSRSFV